MQEIIIRIIRCVLLISVISCSSTTKPEIPLGIRVPEDFAYADVFAAPRPNCNEIAFVRQLGTKVTENIIPGLYLVNLETSEIDTLLEGRIGKVTWLNEDTIVFPDYSRGGRLFLYNIQQKNIIQLNDALVYNPSSNSIDSTIAYDSAGDISVVDIKSGISKVILSGGHTTPAWSPNGSMIAFGERTILGQSQDISLISPEGAFLQRLTEPKSFKIDSYPSWDSDNESIIYHSRYADKDGYSTYKIVHLRIQGLIRKVLTPGLYPVFSNNNESIFYSRIHPINYNELRIYQLNITTGLIQQITF